MGKQQKCPRLLIFHRNKNVKVSFKFKNKGTFFFDIFWSEQNWLSYGVFIDTCATHKLLGTLWTLCTPDQMIALYNNTRPGCKQIMPLNNVATSPCLHTLMQGQMCRIAPWKVQTPGKQGWGNFSASNDCTWSTLSSCHRKPMHTLRIFKF